MQKSLKATVNEVMAMAVLDLFPGTLLGMGKVTETQFSYCFHFKSPLHPELLSLVSEKMRGILKDCPPVEAIEMAVPAAASFFDHHGQPFKAEAALDTASSLIPLIRIGHFCDFMLAEPYNGGAQIAFQLLDVKTFVEDDLLWCEISGTAFESKEELKAFIKKRKQWLKDQPWEEAVRLGLLLYHEDVPILLPKGMEIYRRLEAFWRTALEKEGKCREILAFSEEDYHFAAKRLKSGVAVWGQESDLCLLFPSRAELMSECISSLQFIHQTFNMLELEANWVLFSRDSDSLLEKALKKCGFSYAIERWDEPDSSIELQISDTLGERFGGPFLNLKKDDSLKYSLLGPINRLIALMAERKVNFLTKM